MAAPDLFDAYFRRADVDRDGRISGQEAVSFFQGANLHREVLAKVWQYADKGQTGFLSRLEFYNALKLVTVAQSGRELTPALVSKALSEPAASQIPAPQIQMSSIPTAMNPQLVGSARPVQSSVVPGPVAPGQQQYTAGPLPQGFRPTMSTQLQRTSTLSTPAASANISSDWPSNKSSSWPGPGAVSNPPGIQLSQTKATLPTQDLFQGTAPVVNAVTPPKTTVEPDLFGGDVFTAVPTNPQITTIHGQSKGSAQTPQLSLTVPNQPPQPRGPQVSGQPDIASLEIVPTSSTPTSVAPRQLQAVASSAGRAERGFAAPLPAGSKPWPKMTDAVVRRYTKIFFDVDTDKDGKISGAQARDLFLSWRLPREVLKQVWDLSDQDHDSMLSLNEFCVALYLMERHREGCALPTTISPAFYFDESGLQALRLSEAHVAVPQNSAGHNVPAWQHHPGVLQSASPGSQPRPLGIPVGSVSQAMGTNLPPRPVPQGGQTMVRTLRAAPGQEGSLPVQPAPAQPPQQKSKAPALEMDLVNQLPADDQLTLQTKHQEAVDAEKKVIELERQILDSKERMDFYRLKMQEIVLFKTRCDNRLAEITERIGSDKREVETFTKRYNEKFKQAGDSQSRLLADEAAFRDVQERRLELYNSILRLDQGGDSNALLQSHAEKLQTDLDALRKSLNSKCKQLGVRIKVTTLAELPYGWKPGAQENAAAWDDDWDKFEDEGFTYVQEFMEDGTPGSNGAKPKTLTDWDENGHYEDGFEIADERLSNGNGALEEANYDSAANGHSDLNVDSSSSSPIQPMQTSIIDAVDATKDTQSHGFDPSSWPSDTDPIADEGGDWASAFSHKSDDTDSTISWGRNDASSNKTLEEPSFITGKSGTTSSLGYSDPFDMLSSPVHMRDAQDEMPSFGPIRTKENSSVFFDNSVPSTPLYNTTSFGQSSTGGFFDESVPSTPFHNVSKIQGPSPELFRFDSFTSNATNDIGHTSDSFARFDSFNSNAGQASRRSSDASSAFR
ncbi:hypothetical protein GOP47_0002519 [Adiantum capillus-veneris]|uniref:Uncharacterized protein n=1 Tax=Adiantum capillus-veneris TaxID=13818 RepID=A0A9D4VBR3_ADICA|nr:hypothetical protein GOP47_0002519 [Adiantum capillus-veneris]